MSARADVPFTRVYFVGAGLTAGMGYPVGSQIVPSLLRYLGRTLRILARRQNEAVKKITKRRLGKKKKEIANLRNSLERLVTEYFRRDLEQAANIPVAEFYSIAQMMSESPAIFRFRRRANAPKEQAVDPGSLYHRLAALTRTYFTDIFRSSDLPIRAEAVLSGIKKTRHAVVDFNWDEEVDFYLPELDEDEDADVAYTLGSRRRNRDFLLLKPHGSVGWYDAGQGIVNEDQYFICLRDERIRLDQRRIVAYEEIELPEPIDESAAAPELECPPVITPPTFGKRFTYREQELVWQDVIEVCSHAKEFVFLGYSLGVDDYLTRASIRNALQRQKRGAVRCLLVTKKAGDPDVIKNFNSVFGSGFMAGRNCYECGFGGDEKGETPEKFRSIIERRLEEAKVD